ncbi:acyl carrier protein [Streptomyces inhibens]|uniref:acyl carrier protein n=1 Tax=Streptomyces inhibens TaxID=2293571 RepID=UPI00402A899E
MSDSYTAICEALTETFGVEPADLRPDVSFEQLEVDSLALLELALVMSERLGVTGEADLRPATTLGEAAEFVDALRSPSGIAGGAGQEARTTAG